MILFEKEIQGTELILNTFFHKIQSKQRWDISSEGKFY